MNEEGWFSIPLIDSVRDLLHQAAQLSSGPWDVSAWVIDDRTNVVQLRNNADLGLSDLQRDRIILVKALICGCQKICQSIFDSETISQLVASQQEKGFVALLKIATEQIQEVCISIEDGGQGNRVKTFKKMSELNRLISFLAFSLGQITPNSAPHPLDRGVDMRMKSHALYRSWSAGVALESLVGSINDAFTRIDR